MSIPDYLPQHYPLFATVSDEPGTVLDEIYVVIGWNRPAGTALMASKHAGRQVEAEPFQLFVTVEAANTFLDEVETGTWSGLTSKEVQA